MISANIMICVSNVFYMSKDDFQKFISQKNFCFIYIFSYVVSCDFLYQKKTCRFFCFFKIKSKVVRCWCYNFLEMLSTSFLIFQRIYSSIWKKISMIFFEEVKKPSFFFGQNSRFMQYMRFQNNVCWKIKSIFFFIFDI